MNEPELELLAKVWVDDDETEGSMERAFLDVERTDLDEVRIGVLVPSAPVEHIYLAPDRAVRLAQALIFEASKAWRLP
jgi:hypothetical protein